jgi:hypothetical protein
MWVVQPPSPLSSGPPTPAITPAIPYPPQNPFQTLTSHPTSTSSNPSQTPATVASGPPYTTAPAAAPSSTITANTLPGGSISGRLSGVVSLTDVLNLIAKASGLNPHDPNEQRQRRRRSSSASARRSIESSRSESVGGGSSVAGSRRGSVTGRRPTVGG